MEKLKVVIIEDEELGRELVKNYLSELDTIEIVKECENGFEGAKAINELKPDLVFLDIQMPKLNGFEMIELIDRADRPEIIFTTAYNQFAIQAFELNAIDYLLKPFSKERFFESVSKAQDRLMQKEEKSSEDTAVTNLTQKPITESLERVVVKSHSKISVVSVNKIKYIEAQDDYVMIYTQEGKHLKQATMKYFEQNLNPAEFLRVHRSYIIRIDQVSQLEPYGKDSYVARLKDGAVIKISKSGLKTLKDQLNF